ncbi:hypothetical protein GIB67_031296 [Kingdonia uniflora]|uniref:BTB domain-containing protein n=1 Tax=Kingdonia uniflora TaxID=39325 RepID=A0A7J7P666_9MAGN|nr:hypothetical protein GIB67_031296 [Kingdonia uniflora]
MSSSQVRLNIGGKKFCTTMDTLTQREPDSMLAAMFSGRHTIYQDSEKGFVFVDRDGKHFRHILNWLRDGVVPTLKGSEYQELLREAEYYQLLGLVEAITVTLNTKRDESESKDDPKAELTRTDIIKCIQSSERVKFRGVNLSGLDLSKLDLSFVDFSFACLQNVIFSRTNLQCAKFRDVDACGSTFLNANLREKVRVTSSYHFPCSLSVTLITIARTKGCGPAEHITAGSSASQEQGKDKAHFCCEMIIPIIGFMLNTDESALNSTEQCGAGGIVSDQYGRMVFAFSVALGYASNTVTELLGFLIGLQYCNNSHGSH